MEAIKAIMGQLENEFAALDAKVLASTQEWALNTKAAVKAFEATDEAKALRKNAWAFYPKVFALARWQDLVQRV